MLQTKHLLSLIAFLFLASSILFSFSVFFFSISSNSFLLFAHLSLISSTSALLYSSKLITDNLAISPSFKISFFTNLIFSSNLIFLRSFFIILLSIVNSSKCNCYHIIESSSHKYISLDKSILSLTIVTSGKLSDHCVLVSSDTILSLFSRC